MMKKIYLITLVWILSNPISSQDINCNRNDLAPEIGKLKKSMYKNDEGCNTLRLHFYLLRNDNGEGGDYEERLAAGMVSSEEDYVNQHLDVLNQGFAFSAYPDKLEEEIHSGIPYGDDIQFVSEGWEYLDRSDLLVAQESPDVDDYLAVESSGTAINVYLGTGGNISFATFPGDITERQGMVMARSTQLGNLLGHEMGHNLGLSHTYTNVGRFSALTGDYLSQQLSMSEVYTLTPEFPFGEYCETDTDHICDTYPAPFFGSDANCEFASNNANNYHKLMPLEVGVPLNINELDSYDIFPFARVEENGDPYQFRQHDNFMGSGSSICKTKFTPGQSQRMNFFLDELNSLTATYSDIDFINTHTLEVSQISACGENDGTIEISVPKGGTVSEISGDEIINSSVNGSLTLDNLGPGHYEFLVEGSEPCQVYYFTQRIYFEECYFDFNNDNSVGISDLLIVTSLLGKKCCPADFNNDFNVDELDEQHFQLALDANVCEEGNCPEDLNEDGVLDDNDYAILESQIGEKCECCIGDGNHDGNVSITDLVLVISSLGTSCEEDKFAHFESIFDQNIIASEVQMNALMDALSLSDLSLKEKEELEEIFRAKITLTDREAYVMSIYPSPTSDYVTISSDVPTERLQILNAQGQVILETSKISRVMKLDVSHLPNGIYIVRDRENVVQEQKLIIAR